jgi:uncharacterized phage protein (TIGR02216 family)
MRERTPWAAWLRLAQAAFALSPPMFWRLSVREWRALAGAGAPPMRRSEFQALAVRFPDES